MGRPRKPTRVLELQGAFKKDPQRRAARENEPEVTTPLGSAPKEFDEAHTARWEEIATWCPWLTVADRPIVETICRLWMRMRNNTGSPADIKTLVTCLAHVGMTPSDRSKIKVPPKRDEQNPYAELA